MDTKIGKFTLTKNQKDNLLSLDVDFIKGVSFWENGDIVAVSEKELSPQQVSEISQKINAVPDSVDIEKAYILRNRKRTFLEGINWTKEQWQEFIFILKRELNG